MHLCPMHYALPLDPDPLPLDPCPHATRPRRLQPGLPQRARLDPAAGRGPLDGRRRLGRVRDGDAGAGPRHRAGASGGGGRRRGRVLVRWRRHDQRGAQRHRGVRRRRLGVLRGGMGDVFGKEAGIPKAPEKGLRVLLEGTRHRIDLGRANERYFLLMAGVGFDAEVVKAVPSRPKRLLGSTSYALWAVAKLPRYRARPVDSDRRGRRDLCERLLAAPGQHAFLRWHPQHHRRRPRGRRPPRRLPLRSSRSDRCRRHRGSPRHRQARIAGQRDLPVACASWK